MSVYVLIEMSGIDLLGVQVIQSVSEANARFEHFMERNSIHEAHEMDLDKEAEGTLRFAGDDAYSIQLISCPIQGSST